MTGISEEEVKWIEKWMNNYPRKLFDGKNSNEIYAIFLYFTKLRVVDIIERD